MPGDDSLVDVPSEPVHLNPPIAGFWRRFAACLLDVLLLGSIGQVIGWTMSPVWFAIGPYGRFVGMLVVVLYFGVLNSRIGNGQTLGKRLLKIAVRNRHDQPIHPGRSTLRIAILAAPALLNGWALPVFQSVVLQWCLAVIVFGVGSALVYTVLFNRAARQGLHDLACGTYVVHLRATPIGRFPSTPRLHVAVAAVLVGVVPVGGIVAAYFATTGSFAGPLSIQRALLHDTRFFSVSVQDNTLHAPGASFRSLEVQVWYRGVPPDAERSRVMNDVAREVLRSAPHINQYDFLAVGLLSAYDIGIASGSVLRGDRQPPSVWQQRVSEPTR